MFFILCNPQKVEFMSGGVCNPLDTKTVLNQMIKFFSAGLRAPSAVGDFKNKSNKNE